MNTMPLNSTRCLQTLGPCIPRGGWCAKSRVVSDSPLRGTGAQWKLNGRTIGIIGSPHTEDTVLHGSLAKQGFDPYRPAPAGLPGVRVRIFYGSRAMFWNMRDRHAPEIVPNMAAGTTTWIVAVERE